MSRFLPRSHKHGLMGLLFLALLGCSEPNGVEEATKGGTPLAGNAAKVDPVIGEERSSLERSADLACNAPGYAAGQIESYPGLHSPLYPAIQDKQAALLAETAALAPKVGDEASYDADADRLLRHKMAVLSQFAFLTSNDLKPRMLDAVCSFAAYQEDACALSQRLLGASLTLSDLAMDAEGLRYDAAMADGSRASIRVSNADWDSVLFESQTPAGARFLGEWHRAPDGTEQFESSGSEGVFGYLERPDCSGTARAIRTDSAGHPWTLHWQWSDVRDRSSFSLKFKECKTDRGGEEVCLEGAI